MEVPLAPHCLDSRWWVPQECRASGLLVGVEDVVVTVDRVGNWFVAHLTVPAVDVVVDALADVPAAVQAALADHGRSAAAVVVRLGAGHTGRLGRIAAVQDRIVAAAWGVGARWVALAGSVARGQDGRDSDVDLVIDVDLTPHGLWPALDLQAALADLLPGERLDVVPLDALRDDVRASIRTDAVVLAGATSLPQPAGTPTNG